MPRTKKTNPVQPPVERTERALFPYQLETVELMEAAERTQMIVNPLTGFCRTSSTGLLENEVGSGKTATMLKLVKNHKRPFERVDTITIYNSHDIPSIGNPQLLFPDPVTGEPLVADRGSRWIKQFHTIPTTLVVCSKPIVGHWKREAEDMLVDCMTIDAPKQVVEEELNVQLRSFLERVGDKGSVIVVSTHLFAEFMDHICRRIPAFRRVGGNITPSLFFHRLIFDDIHSVTKWTNPWYPYSAAFLWFVNSTFDAIPGSRIDYISRRTSLFPRYVEDVLIRIKVPVPETTYTLPPIVENRAYYRDRTITRRLENHLPEHVREMLQTGDFTGAYAAMTGLQADEGGQLTIPVSARQPIHLLLENGYNREIEDLTRRKGQLIELGHSTENVDQRIAGVHRQLEALRERMKEICSETVECPICMDETDREHRAVVKCCNNVFCKSCIGTTILRNGTCPLCRERVGMDCLYSMDEEGRLIDLDYRTPVAGSAADPRSRLPSTPMEALRIIVEGKPNGRFVVFAPTEYSSATYRNYFRGTGITFADMGGSAATIRNHLESFQSGGLRILFMSSRTSNAGLNLQCATDVIIIGDRDGSSTQAIGRVRRFPRTEPVPVHYILRN